MSTPCSELTGFEHLFDSDGMALVSATAAESLRALPLTGWPVAEPVLPMRPELASVLPDGGLRPGSTVSVIGSTSLLLCLASEVSAAGGWVAAVGFDTVGAVAAAEIGIDLERFVVIGEPGAQWASVAAVLLDAADLMLLKPPPRPNSADLRRLTARARERKAVLLCAGEWQGADLRLVVGSNRWDGLGVGHGHLSTHELEITVEGRRSPRPRSTSIRLS